MAIERTAVAVDIMDVSPWSDSGGVQRIAQKALMKTVIGTPTDDVSSKSGVQSCIRCTCTVGSTNRRIGAMDAAATDFRNAVQHAYHSRFARRCWDRRSAYLGIPMTLSTKDSAKVTLICPQDSYCDGLGYAYIILTRRKSSGAISQTARRRKSFASHVK